MDAAERNEILARYADHARRFEQAASRLRTDTPRTGEIIPLRAPLQEAAAAPTRREVEVLQLVADGRSNKEIGEALNLSALTVKSHLSRIGRKLGTGDRAQMVALAMRAGVIR